MASKLPVAALLALLAACWLTLAVSAQGPVLDGEVTGDAGMQADMAVLSPRPRSSEAISITAQSAIVRPDGPLTRVQFWPWPPVQGQTIAVYVRTSASMSVTATFAGVAHAASMAGPAGWVFVPIPPLMAPGPQPLALSTGQSTVTLTLPVQEGTFATDVVPASTADPILSQADKVQAETTRLNAIFSTRTTPGWTPHSRFQSPLKGEFPHTSPYGSRRVYGSGGGLSFHAGEDFGAGAGTPVLAPADGMVVLAEKTFVRGNAVILDHGNGVYTGYWHMQVLDVKPGDRVVTGQELGEVGSTGMSTGAHLHWELEIDGVPVDPLQWLAK